MLLPLSINDVSTRSLTFTQIVDDLPSCLIHFAFIYVIQNMDTECKGIVKTVIQPLKSLASSSSSDTLGPMVVKFEYHILYSESYEVPVLYLKASNAGEIVKPRSTQTCSFRQ